MEKIKGSQSELRLIIIGAILGAVPIVAVTYINNSHEDQRIIAQAKVARQNFEIEKCREEIDRFIHNYENFKAETNVIIKNLSKMPIITLEDFYAPDVNSNNFYLKEEDLKKRFTNLGNLVGLLQNNYFELTSIHRISIPENVIAPINGIYTSLRMWNQLDNEKHSAFPISNLIYPAPHWYPNPDLIPPKDQLKFLNFSRRSYIFWSTSTMCIWGGRS